MRELSFSYLWPKLAKPTFTTFRFARKDKDWAVGEQVKVLFKQRSKHNRSVLGIAEIVGKEPRWVANEYPGKNYAGYFNVPLVTEREAQVDGFVTRGDMVKFIGRERRLLCVVNPLHKLTLAWRQIFLFMPEQKPHISKAWGLLIAGVDHGRPQEQVRQDVLDAIQGKEGGNYETSILPR